MIFGPDGSVGRGTGKTVCDHRTEVKSLDLSCVCIARRFLKTHVRLSRRPLVRTCLLASMGYKRTRGLEGLSHVVNMSDRHAALDMLALVAADPGTHPTREDVGVEEDPAVQYAVLIVPSDPDVWRGVIQVCRCYKAQRASFETFPSKMLRVIQDQVCDVKRRYYEKDMSVKASPFFVAADQAATTYTALCAVHHKVRVVACMLETGTLSFAIYVHTLETESPRILLLLAPEATWKGTSLLDDLKPVLRKYGAKKTDVQAGHTAILTQAGQDCWRQTYGNCKICAFPCILPAKHVSAACTEVHAISPGMPMVTLCMVDGVPVKDAVYPPVQANNR